MAIFHGFEPCTPSGKAFLGGSEWILASKAYIHYGPWLFCPDEPLKHLFMASGSLQKAQNKWTIFMVLNPVLLLGGFFGLTMVDGW